MRRPARLLLAFLTPVFFLAALGWFFDPVALVSAGKPLTDNEARLLVKLIGLGKTAFLIFAALYFAALGYLVRALAREELATAKIFLEKETALAEIARVEAVRSHFIAMVSHEFRTPLARLGNDIQLLRNRLEELEDSPLRERALQIERQHRIMTRSINNIISLARIQNQDFRLDPAPGHIARHLRELTDRFAPDLEAKNQRLELDFQEPGSFPFDGHALDLCLNNLLDNAIRYSPAGATIRLACRENGDACQVVFQNPLPPHHQVDPTRIFDRFYRGTQGEVNPADGSGLGLFLVRYLAELQRGSIVCWMTKDSILFELRLPLA